MKNKVKLDSEKKAATVAISSLSHDGRGIAFIGNKITFISGALPSEQVAYEMTQTRSQYNEAKTIDILSSSLDRQSPICEHFGVCGGCSLQHMSDELQINYKQASLLEQLQRFGKVTPENVLTPISAEITGYRRKARLGVKYVEKKRKVLVGFREKNSRFLADLKNCHVLYPKVGLKLEIFSSFITELKAYRDIPQIEVAIGDNEIGLIFRHLKPLCAEDLLAIKNFGKQYGYNIYLQPNSPAQISKIWPETSDIFLRYQLPQYNIELLFHPLDFTQVNLSVNRLMIEQALKLLDVNPNDNILDLFSGIGNFTLPLARYAKSVVGIEGSAEMVERACYNANHNNIKNVNFYAANLFATEASATWIKPYNKILLDPPRAGAKEILPILNKMQANKILYISCNPATLARDAHDLVHLYNYRLNSIVTVNMFPHTSHIEAMAIFEK